jgi:hypothetical protein
MADITKDTTLVLPSRKEVERPPLNPDPVFRDMWEEKRGPVKSLGEAGLTKIVVAYQDKKGVLKSKTALVSHETCEDLIALLNEEQLG